MISEDEALLQLDRELDKRMRNLCRKECAKVAIVSDKVSHSNSSESNALHGNSFLLGSEISKDHSNSVLNSGSTSSRISNEIARKDNIIKNETRNENTSKEQNLCTLQAITSVESVAKTENGASLEIAGNHKNMEKDSGEHLQSGNYEDVTVIDEAEDAVFDEFLDQSTKLRIKTLTNKVSHLSEVLDVKQAECKKLVQSKQEALSNYQTAEMNRRSISKQLQTTQHESTRLSKSNKLLHERVKELTSECQTLRKELSSIKQSQCEQKSAQTSSLAQLTRLRTDNATHKEQITDLKRKHKEELDELRSVNTRNGARIKELERQQRNYCALVKKQELLIRVLNEQKINIGVAKTAACLEEKFLSILTPLQPP